MRHNGSERVPAGEKMEKDEKDQWLILFLAGVLLLVVAMPTGKSSSKTVKQQNAQTEIVQTNGTGSGESDYEKHWKHVWRRF